MKLVLPFCVSLLLCCSALFANGVGIVDASAGVYLRLIASSVEVSIQGQIAITKTTQTFRNDLPEATTFKYAFPTTPGGSAVELRYQLDGVWYTAAFNAAPQDTSLPGTGGGNPIAPALLAYLGVAPLFFEILQPLQPENIVVIELTYVELLPYQFGTVTYHYPNDYSAIQTGALDNQSFSLSLSSGREITGADMTEPAGATVTVGAHEATALFAAANDPAATDYRFEYVLSADDLGLFGFSNFMSDTLGCDSLGNGFCAFIVEPNPNPDAAIIPKVFTLIVDRSGSMSGEKIVQARDAAKFIVDHLNTGDLFNIIDFDDQITSFKPDHVPYTPAHRDEAIAYINTLTADGSTNISGAFSAAIPQFANDNDGTYNIIIFFTDGEATAGITSTSGILNHVSNLITSQEVNVSIFTFGIGDNVNKPLLTNLANQNKGIARFLGNDELETAITEFYLTVQNPVLLNTSMQFNPDLVYATYPITLPNLFKGTQLLVVGRYDQPGVVEATFAGEAFGQAASYSYPMDLSAADSLPLRFLPKLWAKQKAEHLLQLYYAATGTPLADTLKAEIEQLSVCYGVITSLTSFIDDPGGGGGPTSILERPSQRAAAGPIRILRLTPIPAATDLTVEFELIGEGHGDLLVEVLDLHGRRVALLPVSQLYPGRYSAHWDLPEQLPAGSYCLRIQSQRGAATAMILVK